MCSSTFNSKLVTTPQHCCQSSATSTTVNLQDDCDVENQCTNSHGESMALATIPPTTTTRSTIVALTQTLSASLSWASLLFVYLLVLLGTSCRFFDKAELLEKQRKKDTTQIGDTVSARCTNSIESSSSSSRQKERRVTFQLPADDHRPSSRAEERERPRKKRSRARRFQKPPSSATASSRRDIKPRAPKRQISGE